MKDMLDRILDIQRDTQIAIYPAIQHLSFNDQMLINTKAMMHEVIEVERELNWKHWKKDVVIDTEKVKNEIVDEFIFLLNQVNICGMTGDELISRTVDKIDVNINRQNSGY